LQEGGAEGTKEKKATPRDKGNAASGALRHRERIRKRGGSGRDPAATIKKGGLPERIKDQASGATFKKMS